ncbi:MAG: YceH family protein [Actinomycetota bacterium]|nr:YceH family protein [Actinomycetota bacterium]
MTILAAVHLAALTGPEQRVLGCLVEKRWTTPDQYPLSLNALRLACNQATNRAPVTDYGEATVRDAVQRLAPYGLTRLASGHQSRAIKYRHLAEEGLGLDRSQLAVLCVLLLRGPQTPGELKSRSERLSPTTLPEVEQRLGELIGRGYVRRLGRRPGQKEDRFEQLLGGEDESVAEEVAAAGAGPDPDDDGVRRPADTEPLSARVTGLEDAVDALRNELSALREKLG